MPGRGDKHSGADDAQISLEDFILDLDEVQRRGAGPHQIDVALPTPWVAEVLRETDAEAKAPGSLGLEVLLQGDGTVVLRGQLELAYSVPCARCLAAAQVDAGTELCLTAVPAQRLEEMRQEAFADSKDSEGVELESEELDEIGYEGRKVDVGRILGEQVLLAYPIRALCERGEDCAGLCSSCGRDLNQEEPDPNPCATCTSDPERAKGAEQEAEAAWKQALRKLSQS